MTIKTEKFVRKPFYIDAVQVTSENVKDVAEWCQGEVRKVENAKSVTEKYVKVHVHRPLNERQTKAFAGDWVLYAGSGFKVYTPKAFITSFKEVEQVEDSPGDMLFLADGKADVAQELFVTAGSV